MEAIKLAHINAGSSAKPAERPLKDFNPVNKCHMLSLVCKSHANHVIMAPPLNLPHTETVIKRLKLKTSDRLSNRQRILTHKFSLTVVTLGTSVMFG